MQKQPFLFQKQDCLTELLRVGNTAGLSESLDGQIRLLGLVQVVHLVRLQTDSIRVFLCQQGQTTNFRMASQGFVGWCPAMVTSPRCYLTLGQENISRCHLWEKICKGQEKKAENVEEKGRKGEENEKRGSKRIK